jgi:hypothetical protein
MRSAVVRIICFAVLFFGGLGMEQAWAVLPSPSQPILVIQDSNSSDHYQGFVPELLTTEGLNGFQTAQLSDLTAAFLANYDVVILPHLTLTAAQATLLQNYVNAGGTLIGFRPDLKLASVFGVASLGTTLSEAWLKIDTTTAYATALDNTVMRFHGAADLYSQSGATTLATLYNSSTVSTASPAAAINSFGTGKAILFSFDLTQSIVLMRQGNPAWAGYPNSHDGYNTMRASGMFMDKNSGQFWNDLGDSALNDLPQADIQLRLFSNLVSVTNSIKRPLPRFWYYPNQNRAMLLMTGDDHGLIVSEAQSEINDITGFGGLFTYNLWYPFTTVSNAQVTSWLASGYTMAIHFNDTAEVDASGVGGSGATWNGMQTLMSTAISSFKTTYPSAPFPVTTRNHFLIWVSNGANGAVDQVAQAKLFQNNGIQLDTSYSSFPNRWGYMNGSGLPMKFLDTANGTLVPVYEQATQYEDDVQLGSNAYSTQWSNGTAQGHYIKSLSDSLTKYNTVVTMLNHPENWSGDVQAVAPAMQYAQTNGIPMSTAGSWLSFWQARAATTLSMPSFTSNVLTFTATGSPAGLTLLVPETAGTNRAVSAFQVDGVAQSYKVTAYQGVQYANVVLTAGTHNVSVTYATAGRILGQITPAAAAPLTTIQAQSAAITVTVAPAADGTYVMGPVPGGSYQVTASAPTYSFAPSSQAVNLNGTDVTGVNFAGTLTGQTLFTSQTPILPNQTDGPGNNYEMGTAFTADVAGQITGIRFYKAPSESGTHVGKIWSGSGVLLETVTFTGETASGWQTQNLSVPLSIAPNTTYVVSVNTANAFYVATIGGLSSQVSDLNLHSVVGNNGLYSTTVGAFPTQTGSSTNYFRDVLFIPTTGGAPPPANIVVDVTTSTDRSGSGATIASPAFTTTSANELLLAFISTDSNTTTNTTVTGVTGGGLTWALVGRANGQQGDAEIWRAFAPTTLSAVTVTASLSQTVGASITVMSFTGVDTTGTNGSGAIGATAKNSLVGAPSASLLTSRAGSLVLGVGNDWDSATARALGANQTLVHQFLATIGDTYWVQRQSSATPVSGTNVTINDTAPTGDSYNLHAVEVMAAPSVLPTSIATAAGTPQIANLNAVFPTNLQVVLKDKNNNPVGGATVIFTAPLVGATGTFVGGVSSVTVTTNGSGVAIAPAFTSNGTQGTYTVAASTPALAGFASFSLTNTIVVPASITASAGTPQSATINTAFAGTLQATVKDASNNGIAGVLVTFTAPTTGASGTFAGGVNTALTNATGVAVSPVFTANLTSGTYTVSASVGGLAATASFSLTNLAGAPASITATAGTGQSAGVGKAFTTALQATVKDVGNNLLNGVSVTFAAPGAGASGTFGGAVTVLTVSGVATAPAFTANTVTGTYNATATVTGVATAANFALTNTAGPAFSIATSAGTPQSAPVGTAFPAALAAKVADSFNNPVAGVVVTFAAPTSGSSGTFAGGVNTATTNASGVATAVAFTANATIGGPYTVAASVSGVSTPANFSLTNAPGAPASITATAGTGQATIVGAAFATTLQATVKDAVGNLLSGVGVTFAAPGTGASGTFGGTATVLTDVTGVATAPALTANTVAGTYTVTATVGGVAAPANFSLTNSAGPAFSIATSAGTPQTATIGTAFPTAMAARVADSFNNPVAGAVVTFTAPAAGASGLFGASATTTATTNSAGVATASTFTANSTGGGYTVTATVGVVATPANFSLTNNAAPPIAIDVTTSTDRSTAGATIVSPSFTTKSTNELLLALVSTDGPNSGASVTVSGVTGAGLTWTLVQRTNAQAGTSEIWRAFAPTALGASTVTATLSQSVAASITVMSFTGVNTTGTGGSGAIGAVGTGSAGSGGPTATLVTTKANSWVVGVGNDWDAATARTPGANQTVVHQYLATIGDTYWMQRVTSLSPAGTPVTVNDTAPTADQYNLAICEIVGQ